MHQEVHTITSRSATITGVSPFDGIHHERTKVVVVVERAKTMVFRALLLQVVAEVFEQVFDVCSLFNLVDSKLVNHKSSIKNSNNLKHRRARAGVCVVLCPCAPAPPHRGRGARGSRYPPVGLGNGSYTPLGVYKGIGAWFLGCAVNTVLHHCLALQTACRCPLKVSAGSNRSASRCSQPVCAC